jgi:UDP-glucose 4-epimerase
VPLTVVSPGTQTRDFTHIDDIIDGIAICADRGAGDGYLLGAGREWAILDVAELFGAPYEMVEVKRGERVHGRADSTKVRALGWKPRRSLDVYVADFVAARPRPSSSRQGDRRRI